MKGKCVCPKVHQSRVTLVVDVAVFVVPISHHLPAHQQVASPLDAVQVIALLYLRFSFKWDPSRADQPYLPAGIAVLAVQTS